MDRLQLLKRSIKKYTGQIISGNQRWCVINTKLEEFIPALTNMQTRFFHASLSDWPYNLDSITKRFGKPGSKPPKSDVEARKVAGFMGQAWDSDIAYYPELWQAMEPLHLPGALHFGFSYPSKSHRLVTAAEDGGWRIKPSYYSYGSVGLPSNLLWCYGSGKQNGTKPETESGDFETQYSYHNPDAEPIMLAQSQVYTKTIKKTVQEYGTGCINTTLGKKFTTGDRLPGHLLLTHHPECQPKKIWVKSNNGGVKESDKSKTNHVYGTIKKITAFESHAKNGRESIVHYDCHEDCKAGDFLEKCGDYRGERYFMQSHWLYEQFEKLSRQTPLIYCPKPTRKERNAGLDSFETKTRQRMNPGGLSNDPKFASTQQRNTHSCLKPAHLTSILASLLLPSPRFAPRILFVPCSGTGSEMIGGLLAGWDFVIGVEMSEEYCKIARARLKFWQMRMDEVGPYIDNILSVCNKYGDIKKHAKLQMSLFPGSELA